MIPNAWSNQVNVRDVYPTYPGSDTLGTGVTSPFPSNGYVADTGPAPSTPSGGVGSVEHAVAIGASGNPALWWVSLAVMLLALMYFAKHFGGDASYANLRLSAYNIFTITLSAIIGISLFKVAATKFPVPGLSAVILAS